MALLSSGGTAGSARKRCCAFARLGACGALLLLACACSADSSYGARVLSVQGKSDWQDCKQLEGQRTSYTKQIDDMKALMAKNAAGGGGGLVNTTVHAPVLARLESERTLVSETMADKGCGKASAAAH